MTTFKDFLSFLATDPEGMTVGAALVLLVVVLVWLLVTDARGGGSR